MVTPNDLPRSNGTHARRNGGYVTQSAGFKPAAPKVRMATTPKAVRVTPRPMPMTDSPKFGPLTVRRMTPAELGAARDHAAAVKASRSPFDRG